MIKRLLLLIAVALCACPGIVRAQNIEGQIIAVQYGTWRVQGIPQPATGNSFNFVAAACSQIAGNKTFQAFQVGTPIEIFDADPNLNEVVTPSAVSATNQGCSITAAPVHTHNSFSLGSATAGLQEALNTNEAIPLTNIIVLTAEWYRRGGTSGTIASVQGSTNVSLVDVTKAPYDWYTWNGSMYVKVSLGGANLPHVTEIISGDGAGNGVGMPEKGTNVAGGVGWVAWNEDNGLDGAHGGGLGLFDCRDTKYAGGGCLGSTPGLAMQALANDITCYQAMTGLRANVIFPPGTIPIGTVANPTLVFPTGAHYASSAPNPNGVTTTMQATYNGHMGLHFMTAVTATCSDGNPHTNTLTTGYYGGGIGEKGCAQGGCSNVPGDTANYPNGGQNQIGVLVEDSGGEVDFLGAYENGGEGVIINGESTHSGTIWSGPNNWWYLDGIQQSGVTYNPTTDGWHCNTVLNSLDGTNDGPYESGGVLQTPGAEYGHVCGVYWGGGNTNLGTFFSNRDQIGMVRGDFTSGRAVGGRIDAPMGEGIVVQGGGNSFSSIDNSSACSGFSTVGPDTVFGPYIATLGSGMTNGTYVVPANSGAATLTVTVAGGVATHITVSNAGSGYLATPTFTMTGTGGTPATIGATTYQHCDKLDDSAGQNSYVNVRNIFESFFGTDHSTGDIWQLAGGSFDRGTIGNFEHVPGEFKGVGAHKDLPDPAFASGGVGITGPGPNFSQGTHFAAGDTTPTSWTGPFTVGTIMQDLWIWGNNANTTLPVSAGWQTCSGHDLNLVAPRWYHFLVFQDDTNATVGTNFIFKEQCDTIFEDYLQPGFAWLATNSALPTTDAQATLDVGGSAAVRPYPALGALTLTAAGSTSSFSYCFAIQVWVAGGKQTTGSVCGTKTPPATTTGGNNLFVNLTLPQNWTRYKVYLNSTTDGTFTPGVWYDTTTANALPQPVTTLRLPITTFTPTDTSTIATANLSLNMTGTYNVSIGGVPVPASSNTLCIPGQEIHSCSAGFDYTCTTEDHWVRNAITCSTF